ncbi:MAG: DUF5777 family beta-barrel protein [Bacteroidota bacterium]
MKKLIYTLLLAVLCVPQLQAQEGEAEPQPVTDIFYGTRAINLHTIKQIGKNVLAYRISHRLGPVFIQNSGDSPLYNFLGLDGPASISLMFDYGINDNLMVGVARDQFNKVYNGYVKYNILNQQSGGGSPVTVAVYGKANLSTLKDKAADINGFDRFENFAHRMSYVTQVMIGRRFGERFAAQLSPTYIHHNLVELAGDGNDMFAISAAAQYKFTKRLGISGEFNYVLNDYATNPDQFVSSAGLGLDIVTGGHIFQIHLLNSAHINEAFSIPYTISDWLDGNFRIGFNISRNFWL